MLMMLLAGAVMLLLDVVVPSALQVCVALMQIILAGWPMLVSMRGEMLSHDMAATSVVRLVQDVKMWVLWCWH